MMRFLSLLISGYHFYLTVMTALDVVMIFAHVFMFCLAILAFAVSRNEVSHRSIAIQLNLYRSELMLMQLFSASQPPPAEPEDFQPLSY